MSNRLLVEGLARVGADVHLLAFAPACEGPASGTGSYTCETHPVDFRGVAGHLACARILTRAVRARRPDVVLLLDDGMLRALGFLPRVSKYGARFASVNSGSTLVRENAHLRGRVNAFLVARGHKWLDVVFVSEATARSLRADVPDVADRVRVLGRPIPDSFFELEPSRAIVPAGLSGEPPRPLLFSCSRADEQKGVQLILDALALLRARHGREVADFAYAGEGPALAAWRERAAALGLTRVAFLGAVPFDRIQENYACCYMGIFPSTYPDETFGRTWVEAFACGRPVISTHINNLKHLVLDGVNGLVVEPNADSVAAGIERALALGQDEYLQMSRRARETALPFRQSSIVGQLVDALGGSR